MRSPRTFAFIIASAFALTISPAFAGERAKTKDVEIEIDLNASAAENYDSIRAQAWKVCKPDLGSTYAAARNQVRRECQKQVIADTLKQLPQQDDIQLARTRESVAH